MPNPAALRERRLRMTKAQLIDEIDALEQRATTLEAANRSSTPTRVKASEGYLTDHMTSPNSSPQLLTEIIDSIKDGAAVFDKNDRLVMFNENYSQYFLG